MVPKSKMLTREEFASLLTVANTSAVLEPPAVIPPEHSARLIALGYMADLSGRLRMTTAGRVRIAAGVPKRSYVAKMANGAMANLGHCEILIRPLRVKTGQRPPGRPTEPHPRATA